MTRFFSVTLCCLMLLSACGSNPENTRYVAAIRQALIGNRMMISRDQAGAIPFASIGVTLGRSDQSLMVLGQSENGRQEWYARSQMIAIKDGRIVQTSGLPFDLTRVELRDTSSAGAAALARASAYSLIFDYQDLKLFGAAAECRSVDAGDAEIMILGSRLQTRHVIERCRMRLIDWSFANEFWVDPGNRFVWRSKQYVHPKLAPLTFEVFRAEAS